MTFDQLQSRLERQLDPADWRQTKDGGWVEKTAKVAPSVRVADNAVVYGNAWIDKGEVDFGDWSSGGAWAQYQARQNLAAELEADLEESTNKLVS